MEVIVDVPPMLRVPVAPFVRVPEPDNTVLTESTPELVNVPVIDRLGIEVVVEPLIVLEAPLKVCTPVPNALKVEALFVMLLPNEYVLFAPFPDAGSVQIAPLKSVTSPVNVIALLVLLDEAKLTVPEIVVVPETVKGRFILTVPPELTIKEPIVTKLALLVEASIAPEFTVTDPV
jgi:hypothetical protein